MITALLVIAIGLLFTFLTRWMWSFSPGLFGKFCSVIVALGLTIMITFAITLMWLAITLSHTVVQVVK